MIGRPRLRHARLALLAAGLALAWSLTLVPPHLRGEASFLDRIEAPLTDLRFLVTGPRPAPPDVVIVAIDDATVRAAGAYPLPRPFVARLLHRIAEAGPKAVGLDILFLDPGPEEADADLAAALATGRAVVGMAAVFSRAGPERRAELGPYAGVPVAERLLRPLERFGAVAAAGLVNVATDHGGMARHVPLFVVADGAPQPALPLRLASLAAGRSPELGPDRIVVGAVTTPVDLGASLALRFYGPQESVRTVSAAALLDGSAAADLTGRIVLVGATALGSGDTLSTPYDRVLPGVEVMATAVAHLVDGGALARTAAVRRIDAAVTLALPVLAILLLSLGRVGIGLGLVGALLAALAVSETVLFARGVWLSLALPLAGVAVPLPLYLGARLWVDRRLELSLTKARDALLRFHPPAVAARLETEPDFLATPVEQGAAILFVDLSGFTLMSESLGPAATRALLKEMHDLVEDAATPRDGSVTSFMGDGAMVLFGLPESRPDDADRALAAALDLLPTLQLWLASHADTIGTRSGVRIGIHAGPVVISRLGGTRNQHITATGDTVNVTSRLLELAKVEGASLVITAALLGALCRPCPIRGPIALRRVALRGRVQPLDVHCIV